LEFVSIADLKFRLLRSICEAAEVDLQHLRRFARLDDLPHHLRSPFSESAPADLHLLVGPVNVIKLSELKACLTKLLPGAAAHGFGLCTVMVPLLAPTSVEQAKSWSTSYWPTIYKKKNPFGPHPSIVSRAEDEIVKDLHMWMHMAGEVARCSKSMGYGELIGAVIVERRNHTSHAVVLAGDGRWRGYERNGIGNPMAHAVLRAIGMVAQRLKVVQRGDDIGPSNDSARFQEHDAFLEHPLNSKEQAVYESGQIHPNGYLCHGLEIYITHEPCVACSMALLHSRFARVVFGQRMPKTGGLCSEIYTSEQSGGQSGLGHGLFWRRELNWSLLAWETNFIQPELDINSAVHV
jgi:tRNA-specific adenosine deaminase 3